MSRQTPVPLTADQPGPASAHGSIPSENLWGRVSLLCVVSGSLDAISFLAFGEAFSSVMTGNVVFVGVAAGNGAGRLALSCGVAIVGYIAGVWVGSRLADRDLGVQDVLWPSAVTRTLVVEFVALVSAGVVWLSIGGDPSRDAGLGFLACASLAMGIQGAAVRAVRAPISTTYMTGALTTLVHAMATGRGFSAAESRALFGLVSLFAGAVLGATALHLWRPGALIVPVLALSSVLFLSLRSHRAVPGVTRGWSKGPS